MQRDRTRIYIAARASEWIGRAAGPDDVDVATAILYLAGVFVIWPDWINAGEDATSMKPMTGATRMERLVDVVLHDHILVHTYPVTADGLDDAACQDKAVRAAAYARLVPDAELDGLTARIHVERGGSLTPYGDRRDVMSQTREGLDQSVRERAYAIWQHEHCPHGAADDHWYRARDHYLREHAYYLWEQNGCPDGQADRHWHETCELETL